MSDSKGNSHQTNSEIVLGLDCPDGVCRVKPRKLFAQAPDTSKLRPPANGARTMVDMLHGDVDLEHLFGG